MKDRPNSGPPKNEAPRQAAESNPDHGLAAIKTINGLLRYAQNDILKHLAPEDMQARVDAILDRAIEIIQTSKYKNAHDIENDIFNLDNLRKAINATLKNSAVTDIYVIGRVIKVKKRLQEVLERPRPEEDGEKKAHTKLSKRWKPVRGKPRFEGSAGASSEAVQ